MPLPRQHLKKLERDLPQHERRIAELRELIRGHQDEIRVLETVVNLGNDRKLQDALGEIYDDPTEAGRINWPALLGGTTTKTTK